MNEQELIQEMQEAYEASQETRDFDIRKSKLKTGIEKVAKQGLQTDGFTTLLNAYSIIEQANNGEDFDKKHLHYDARNTLETILMDCFMHGGLNPTQKEKEEFFDISISYRNRSVKAAKELADSLGLELTQDRLKKIQKGLIRSGAGADQLQVLEERFGIPFTKEIAESYVETTLKRDCTHVLAGYAISVIKQAELDYDDAQKENFIKTMVENGNSDDAIKVSEFWNLDTSWIKEIKANKWINNFYDAINTNDVSKLGHSLSWVSHDFLKSLPKENPQDFEKVIDLLASDDYSWDNEFCQHWPEYRTQLTEKRISKFDDPNATEQTKVALASRIMRSISRNSNLEGLLSDEHINEFVSLALNPIKVDKCQEKETNFGLWESLVKNTRYSPTDKKVEKELRKRMDKANPINVVDDYKRLKRELTPEFKRDLFNETRKKIVKDGCGFYFDLVETAKELDQPVDKQLHIDNLKSAGWFKHFHDMVDKYGLPENLTQNEKQGIYDNITSKMGWLMGFEGIKKATEVLDINFDKEILVKPIREHLYSGAKEGSRFNEHIMSEKVERLYDEFGILGDEILDGLLETKQAASAVRMGQKLGVEDKVIDYFIKHRNNSKWNHYGGAHRTQLDEAILDASVKLGKADLFFEKIVEEADVNWISKFMMVVKYKPELTNQLIGKTIPTGKLYGLQEKLVEKGKYQDAETMAGLFPNVPICPGLIKYRTSLN